MTEPRGVDRSATPGPAPRFGCAGSPISEPGQNLLGYPKPVAGRSRGAVGHFHQEERRGWANGPNQLRQAVRAIWTDGGAGSGRSMKKNCPRPRQAVIALR